MRVGIIGAGSIASTHLKGYKAHAAQVTAVCDLAETPVVREVVNSGGRWYRGYRDLLQSQELDAVSVCTTPDVHSEICITAMESGANVLCEKPFANTVLEAEQMVAVAERTGRLLMAGFCYRFHPPVARAKEWIQAGEIGRVLMFRQRFGFCFDGRGQWQMDRRAGGGVINESMVHSFDLFHYLVGPSKSAIGVWTHLGQGGDGEDMAIVCMESESGAIGVTEGSWSTPFSVNNLEVYGSTGMIVVDFGVNFNRHTATLCQQQGTVEEAYPETGEPPIRFLREIGHFLDCVRAGVKSDIVDTSDGLKSVQVVERLRQEARRS
ncbi:MAG: Gfo/Idh/MocA family oxidoreductase [Armatimonadetes bacterium]|nr:Gfo/Idh/MocA family oxidoreductase [Armatimonadota bacterium]